MRADEDIFTSSSSEVFFDVFDTHNMVLKSSLRFLFVPIFLLSSTVFFCVFKPKQHDISADYCHIFVIFVTNG